MPPLMSHASTPSDAVARLDVEAGRRGGRLALTYRLQGRLAALAIPGPAAPRRTDELWKHTCFEAFVRPGDGATYVEFNLAPSGRWAAYAFDDYREGMRPADIAAPVVQVGVGEDTLELAAELDLGPLPGFADAAWSVALSAVIEDASGPRSYWALAHPPGKPDFHHRAGFVLHL